MIPEENVSVVDQLLQASDAQSCCRARYQVSRALERIKTQVNTPSLAEGAVQAEAQPAK